MARSQDEQIAAFRNFFLLSTIGLVILLICFYLSGMLLVFLVYNKAGIVKLLSMRPEVQLLYLLDLFTKSWQITIVNFQKIGIAGSNYFIPKLVASSTVPLSLLLLIFYKFREPIMDWKPFKVQESQYGEAHWATPAEIKKAGLFHNGSGMTMGMYKGKLLVVDKTNCQHALLFAPTGSGKGVGFVLPNLLFWDDSVIVHDVKLENFEITSGYRTAKMHQKCYLWNPADQDGYTHCYNPMDFIARDYGKQVDDVMKITKFLLPKEEFWTNEGRALATGVMLALLACDDRPISMGEVLRTLRSDDVSYNIAVLLDTRGEFIHPTGYMNLAAYLQKPDKERGSVTSTAASAIVTS